MSSLIILSPFTSHSANNWSLKTRRISFLEERRESEDYHLPFQRQEGELVRKHRSSIPYHTISITAFSSDQSSCFGTVSGIRIIIFIEIPQILIHPPIRPAITVPNNDWLFSMDLNGFCTTKTRQWLIRTTVIPSLVVPANQTNTPIILIIIGFLLMKRKTMTVIRGRIYDEPLTWWIPSIVDGVLGRLEWTLIATIPHPVILFVH